MRTSLSTAALIWVVVVPVACGGSTTAPAEGVDAAADTAVAADTVVADTQVDTRVDTATTDTATPDTAAPDTSVPCGVAADATIHATFRLTADNERKVYLNGTLLDDAPYSWGDARSYDVTLFLHPKKVNVVAVEGINTSSQGGYDRGILAVLTSTSDAGTAFTMVSDASWKISPTLVTDWFLPATSDAAWVAALEQTPNGSAPWGTVADIPATAKWIWTYDSSTATTKPDNEHVYARRSFYFAIDGSVSETPATCSD